MFKELARIKASEAVTVEALVTDIEAFEASEAFKANDLDTATIQPKVDKCIEVEQTTTQLLLAGSFEPQEQALGRKAE